MPAGTRDECKPMPIAAAARRLQHPAELRDGPCVPSRGRATQPGRRSALEPPRGPRGAPARAGKVAPPWGRRYTFYHAGRRLPVRDKAVITSALPYANGEIHLGHVASTYLPADVTARFLRMKGVEAYYICASDDFGTPILIQSEREGKTPAEYVAHWNRRDREDFESLGVSFDHFGSTSSPRAVGFARRAFDDLLAAGHIYEADVVQPYCEADGMFLPDRYVRGTCPSCGAEDQYSDLCEACGRIPSEVGSPRCSMCGAAPVKRSSRHYFFRLGAFAGELADWLEGSAGLQPDVKRYVLNWIRGGLSDWDITRDMSWGVPVPPSGGGAERGGPPPPKVLYGWFDNHLSYISAASEFLEGRGIDAERFWNGADVYHFIGKDIVYHHYLFLPAMRMGLGRRFKLPDYMPTRGHLTLESRKISKSRGWYIGLRDFLAAYPADYLRFYLLLISPYSQDDLNFDWGDFAARVNSDLIGNVGNLVNRAVGFACSRHGGEVPAPGAVGGADKDAERRITVLSEEVGRPLSENRLDKALKAVLEFSASFNRYFQHSEPWKGGAGAATCVYTSVNAVRSVSIALHPFLPSAAAAMWAQLGLGGGGPGSAGWDAMSEMGIRPGHRLGEAGPLFAKIDMAGIERRRGELAAAAAAAAATAGEKGGGRQ